MSDKDEAKLPDAVSMPGAVSTRQLITNPSVLLWKQELLLIKNGLRAERVSPLGSIEQYVRVLLAESKDNVSAELCFREALYQTVQEWNPRWDESDQHLETMLSLILAFTPTVGFNKVLKFLDSQNMARLKKREIFFFSPVGTDLNLKALRALAAYYPSAPHHSQDDLGFSAYLKLLEKFLLSEPYAGYAASRLIDLDALETNNSKFLSVLRNPKALSDIVPYLLSKARVASNLDLASRMLGDIFIHLCDTTPKHLDSFATAIHAFNASFENDSSYGETYRPIIRLSSGMVVPIQLDMEGVAKYSLQLYETSLKVMLMKLRDSAQSEKLTKRQLTAIYLQAIGFGPDKLGELESHFERMKIDRFVRNEGLEISCGDQKFEINLPQSYLDPYLEYYYPTQDPMKEIEATRTLVASA